MIVHLTLNYRVGFPARSRYNIIVIMDTINMIKLDIVNNRTYSTQCYLKGQNAKASIAD